MKKLLFNLSALRLVIAISVLFIATEVSANNETPAKSNVELNYLGVFNNNPLIEIVFSGNKEEIYTIGFRDKDGVLFYSEKVKIASGTKKFALNADEVSLSAVTIEVKNRNNKKEEVFTLQSSKNIVEETVVVKVK